MLLDQLSNDIKQAMKDKNKPKLGALRYLKSMLMENKVSKKPTDELDVVVRHTKKLKEAIEVYPDGDSRQEDAKQELIFVEEYLPKQLTEVDVQAIINEIKSGLDNPNMGGVMKELTAKIKGRFDGKKASQMVKDSL